MESPKEHVVRRFYVDERTGCIAVREKVDYEISQGLHEYLPDVVAHWTGESYKDEANMTRWRIAEWQQKKAIELCELLNV